MSTKALIIGLGGVGSDIICDLEQYINKRDKTIKNIEFVTIDTDVNTIAELKRKGFGGRIVTISDNMTVEEYLTDNPNADNWFLKNRILDWKPMTEGAGQIREVSRLAFELAVRNQKLQPLYEAIRELQTMDEGDSDKGAPRVIVVSTLAGGTGSGIVLPLALHLRKYFYQIYKRRDIIIRGLFLMSDCLERVVLDPDERKSLRGNTYAAIKELDAFMKNADGYLPERYEKYVYMENILNEKFEKYLAYNFCYLFSGRDAQNNELHSFQELKKYVWKCIDAQILGPMQNLNNSIEDNVLKSTMVRSQGDTRVEFNRYCAAGIKVLKYPYEGIVEYLSLEKTMKVLDAQWMEIDNAFYEEKKRWREREREGYTSQRISRSDFYINYIENSGESNHLCKEIKKEMQIIGGEPVWNQYIAALDKNIEESGVTLKKTWEDNMNTCRAILTGFKENKSSQTKEGFGNLAANFDELFELVREGIGASQAGMKQRYFDMIDVDSTIFSEHFMHWLCREGKMCHINSVRYFLYQTIQRLEEKIIEAEKGLSKNEQILDNIDDLKKQIADIHEIWWINLFDRRAKIVKNEYQKKLNALEEFCVNKIKTYIYSVGLDCMRGISSILEKFYDEFVYNYSRFQDRKIQVYNAISQNNGKSTQYIGCDQEQLQYLSDQLFDYERDQETNSRLSAVIFCKLWEIADKKDEIQKENITDIFQKDCVEFWQANLKKSYARELDVDVVEAIVREGLLREGRGKEYNYLRRTLQNAWNQTNPLLQIGNNNQAGQTKNFCAFNDSLLKPDSLSEQIIQELLLQRGGVTTTEVDRYSIIFYRVMYNLRAVDIKEFSSGILRTENESFALSTRTDDGGDTFKDYQDIIRIQNDTKLTPHLDWHWSNILMMPDLNESYTVYLEKRVYQAFYILCLESSLSYNGNQKVYSVQIGDMREEYVSLQAVIDKLAGYMGAVDRIVRDFEERVNKSLDIGEDYSESLLFQWCRGNETGFADILVRYLQEKPEIRWDIKGISLMVGALLEWLYIYISAYCGKDRREEEFEHIVVSMYSHIYEMKREGRKCAELMRDVLGKMGKDNIVRIIIQLWPEMRVR